MVSEVENAPSKHSANIACMRVLSFEYSSRRPAKPPPSLKQVRSMWHGFLQLLQKREEQLERGGSTGAVKEEGKPAAFGGREGIEG